jgi:hypothetical protein
MDTDVCIHIMHVLVDPSTKQLGGSKYYIYYKQKHSIL